RSGLYSLPPQAVGARTTEARRRAFEAGQCERSAEGGRSDPSRRRGAPLPAGYLANAMPEESRTPDEVRLARQAYEAVSRGDFDAVMSLFAANAVYDLSDAGLGAFEGAEAIRRFFEDWHGSWEERRF